MTPGGYLKVIKERLVSDPHILHFQIRKERLTLQDGFIRARLTLSKGEILEFAEYFQMTERGEIEVITYSYHWTDVESQLIKRWDNTPHFPNLDGFPHHVHEGVHGEAFPSRPMTIFKVLSIIEEGRNEEP